MERLEREREREGEIMVPYFLKQKPRCLFLSSNFQLGIYLRHVFNQDGCLYYYCLCHLCINLPHPTIMVEAYAYSSVIRGHHGYKETRMPFIGEKLTTDVEEGSLYDQHVVAILKNREVVDHMPCTITQFTLVQSHGLLLLLA